MREAHRSAYQFSRGLHEAGKIDIRYCKTANMLADIITKPLGRVKFTALIKNAVIPIKEFNSAVSIELGRVLGRNLLYQASLE